MASSDAAAEVTTIVVDKTDHGAVDVRTSSPAQLDDGQVLLTVDRFSLTTNNISYARSGDMLGYWAFFPVGDTEGCIPVWGFADVTASTHTDIAVGERLFGYLPMASAFVVTPGDVSDISFQEAGTPRGALHPWYNRYFRCATDPLHDGALEDVQSVLWALFQTGWELAAELAPSVEGVVVSSASSKTALALAWALRQHEADVAVTGLTSAGNRSFVEERGVYDTVLSYDDLRDGALAVDEMADDVPAACAYVNIAGNAEVNTLVHQALGSRLVDSVLVGGTHRESRGAAEPPPGPAPRFFFIPDVAEAHAATEGAEAYHRRFAAAWAAFAPWAAAWMGIDRSSGVEGVVTGYRTVLAGDVSPDRATVVSWA